MASYAQNATTCRTPKSVFSRRGRTAAVAFESAEFLVCIYHPVLLCLCRKPNTIDSPLNERWIVWSMSQIYRCIHPNIEILSTVRSCDPPKTPPPYVSHHPYKFPVKTNHNSAESISTKYSLLHDSWSDYHPLSQQHLSYSASLRSPSSRALCPRPL